MTKSLRPVLALNPSKVGPCKRKRENTVTATAGGGRHMERRRSRLSDRTRTKSQDGGDDLPLPPLPIFGIGKENARNGVVLAKEKNGIRSRPVSATLSIQKCGKPRLTPLLCLLLLSSRGNLQQSRDASKVDLGKVDKKRWTAIRP